MNGIDISQHNGYIDWAKAKADKQVDFAILRTGFGREHVRQIDKQFERNYAECARLGIPVGAYHYSYATTPADAEKEAEFCLKLLAGKKFPYPIWYDIEERSHVQRGNCDDIAEAFCDRLEAAGYFVGIYTFDSFAKTNLTDRTKKRYAMWIARIGSAPKFSDYGIHQYSWTGKIDGISGDVDMNTAYTDYPTAIIGRHLNGYSADDGVRYQVSAIADKLTEEQAEMIMRECSELGMTVVRRKSSDG